MPPRPGPPRLVAGPEECFPGSDYSDEERVFLLAMERYKRQRRRPYPTWREVLHVVYSLGYRRVAEPRPPAPPDAPGGAKGEVGGDQAS
jgi:hypothetical protein